MLYFCFASQGDHLYLFGKSVCLVIRVFLIFILFANIGIFALCSGFLFFPLFSEKRKRKKGADLIAF